MSEILISEQMPILALRGLTVFPKQMLHFDVGREKSVKALELAMKGDQRIFLVTQKNILDDEPTEKHLYRIGTVAKIKQVLRTQGDLVRVLVEGEYRACIGQLLQTEPCLSGRVESVPEQNSDAGAPRAEALMREAVMLFDEFLELLQKPAQELQLRLLAVHEPGFIADTIDSYIKGAQKGSSKPSDWDWDGLFKALKTVFPFELDQDAAKDAADKLKGDKAVEALKELIVSDAKDQYSDFEDKLGSEGLRQLERRVVLAVLDRKWREHLYEMDYLKDGIGLRGMGQRDPLVEYQREGYQMYNSMIEAIKEETIQLLFHVDIERVAMTEDEETESDEDEAVNAAEAVMGLDGEAAATGESAPAEPETDDEAEKTTIDELADEQKNEKGIVGMQPISHAEGKVPANKRPKSEELHSPWADGRTFPGTGKNAQCPCGSGRKYKMCHGQNEQ